MRLIFRWILLAISVLAASWLTQKLGLGFQASYHQPVQLLLGVALLALLNNTLGKLLKLLTLPFNCLTLGLVSLVINALMLILAAEAELGFQFVEASAPKFLSAIVAAILISLINGILNGILISDEEKEERDR